MKMTSDIGGNDARSAKTEPRQRDHIPCKSDPDAAITTTVSDPSRLKAKNCLTFSIDSLVGKSAKAQIEDRLDKASLKRGRDDSSSAAKTFRDRFPTSRSPSPSAKHHCVQQQEQQSCHSATVLPKTPPANGPELAPISEHHQQQQQRFVRQSAFVPAPISSGHSAPSFAAPVVMPGPVPGGRFCWDMTTAEPAAGLWKDAVAASAMYQAAAAAIYSGYPWCAPPTTLVPSELTKKQHLLLQHEQPPVSMLTSPDLVSRAAESHRQHGHNQTTGMIPPTSDQQQNFWHHHIAELLRQNGGHPIHHARLYAGPDAGHAATSFLFSGCRKPKRIRTAFSPNQLMELESAFEKNQYVVGNERKELARRLGLTETQVKVWFQNRRTKAKRMKNEDGAGTPGAASSASSTGSSASVTTKPSTSSATVPMMGKEDQSVASRNDNDTSASDHAQKSSVESTVARSETKHDLDSFVMEDEARENDEDMITEYEDEDEDEDSN